MDLEIYKAQVQENVIDLMLDMLGDGEDCDFSREDIDTCEALLTDYLTTLAGMESPTDEAIMACVKQVVFALNQLNEETDYALIETMEREAIWEIIQNSAIECGLTDPSDDITEEWREW